MNRKKIIQIAITVAAFSASGIVLYRGFAKPKAVLNPPSFMEINMGTAASSSPGSIAGNAAAKSLDKVLPNGDRLDFGILSKQNLQYGLIKYPAVDLQSEVGLPLPQLLSPH